MSHMDSERAARRKSRDPVGAGSKLIVNKDEACALLSINEHEIAAYLNDVAEQAPKPNKLNGRKSGRIWKFHRDELARFSRLEHQFIEKLNRCTIHSPPAQSAAAQPDSPKTNPA